MLTKWMSENIGEIVGEILPPPFPVRDFLLPQLRIEYFWMTYKLFVELIHCYSKIF